MRVGNLVQLVGGQELSTQEIIAAYCVKNEIPGGTIDGLNKIFTIANVFASGTLAFYLRGIRRVLNIEFTETGPQQITSTEAPQVGDSLTVDYTKA